MGTKLHNFRFEGWEFLTAFEYVCTRDCSSRVQTVEQRSVQSAIDDSP